MSSMIESLESRRLMSVSFNAASGLLTVNCSAGNDTVNVLRGGNFLNVSHTDANGSHSDTFFDVTRRVKSIVINTFDGADRIRLDGPCPRTSIYAGAHNDLVNLAGVVVSGAPDQSFWVRGGDGDDVVIGSPVNDGIHGDAGNDSMSGRGGVDAIFGWAGNDFLGGGDGNDYLYGDAGNDTLSGDAGNDTMYGWIGDDILTGGEGNDSLYGQDGNDTLSGNAGFDYLDGGAGTDSGRSVLFDSWRNLESVTLF